MSHTSSKVKNRYNEKSYDHYHMIFKKGQKEIIGKYAAESQNKSLNAYIIDLIKKDMGDQFPEDTGIKK